MNNKLFWIGIVLFLGTSCSSLKNIKVSQIEAIWFEYSPNQNLNNGAKFEGEILLQTYDGKQHEMSKNSNISFSSPDIRRSGNSKSYTLVKKSNSFDDDKCHLTIKYTNRDEKYVQKDSVIMNFRGPLKILYNGANGVSGKHQRNRGTPLLWRDGKDGEHGLNGTNGGSSKNYTVHMWQEENMIFVYSRENNSNTMPFYYKMQEGNSIYFDLSGGNGGNGGNGGDGGDGKDGDIKNNKMRRVGDAGNGGNGGNGGYGGNAGNLSLYIHENCAGIESFLTTKTKGGRYGSRGMGGKRGTPGTPLAGQQAGRQGFPGTNGVEGFKGMEGSVQKYIQSFDYAVYID